MTKIPHLLASDGFSGDANSARLCSCRVSLMAQQGRGRQRGRQTALSGHVRGGGGSIMVIVLGVVVMENGLMLSIVVSSCCVTITADRATVIGIIAIDVIILVIGIIIIAFVIITVSTVRPLSSL